MVPSTETKKERRGRNGRKPSVCLRSSNEIKLGDNSLFNRKNSEQGMYSPKNKKEEDGVYPRCQSANNRRSSSKTSVKSAGNRSVGIRSYHSNISAALSNCLSNKSRKQKKSVKVINASLERLHTFGMSNVHKSILDLQNQSKKQEITKDKIKSYVDESPDKTEQD